MREGYPNDQQFDYMRLIGDLSNSESWFAQWRMMTDGISEEIPWVAPASLVVADGNALIYHFTIADDLLILYNREPARRVQPAAPAAVLMRGLLTGSVITLNQ